MSVHSSYLPATANNFSAPNLVLLHGWGMSSAIWQSWLPLLREHYHITLIDLPGYGLHDGLSEEDDYSCVDELLASIIKQAPECAVYLGYSLGGMLAVKIASRFPKRVEAVITLASNVQFVASESWPEAMSKTAFNDFYALIEKNSMLALKRFSALQVFGSSDEKSFLNSLREKIETVSSTVLIDSLKLLSSLNNTDEVENLSMPSLHIYGEADNLVPVSAARKLQATARKLQGKTTVNISVIDRAAHCLFLDEPMLCLQSINDFIAQEKIPSKIHRVLDKQQVARSFSRAASTYDSVADLQRQVGEKLIGLLPVVSAELVLDLGCGTGFFSSHLQQAFPRAHIVGLDLAEGMTQYAAKHQQTDSWLCGDAENLPLADECVDIIFSSLAIQWCEDNEALLSEVIRVLKPGGRFIFSTLGPNTLFELRDAWRAVDDYMHVNRFVDQSVIERAVAMSGFCAQTFKDDWSEEVIVLEYDSLKQLTRELKSLGAHNVNSGRHTGLTGKQRMRGFIEAYEQQRNADNKLPATYQAWYGLLQKPQSVVELQAGGQIANGA